MYILYNDVKYPCKCKPASTMRYSGLPEDFPAPVSGEIALCADDGFVLRTDKVEDYLRQTFEGGVLTLTNIPEPEPQPEPEEPAPTLEERVSAMEESVAAIEDAMCEMDSANEERLAGIEDALCELDMGGNE